MFDPLSKLFHRLPYAVHAALCCFLVLYCLLLSSLGAMSVQSADLYATWVAGEFLSMGRPDQVYPVTDGLFDMRPPSDWWAHVSQTDSDARIFPYLYPPIWVWLVSKLTPMISFAAFDTFFLILHQSALLGAIVLATRMCGLRGPVQLAALGLTYAGLTLTLPLGLGLAENQPQILVSFLIVLAFERAHFGHLRTAGAVLALAAAIKLYPLLFVVIFLGRRQWPAIISFGVVGLLLGLTSIAVAGWPLHALYLDLIRDISRSVVLTNFSLSIDAFLTATHLANDLTPVHHARGLEESHSWYARSKTRVWVVMSAAAHLMALAGLGWAAARRPNDPLIVPLTAIALALLGSLSWAYTYMTAFVFLGLLPVRLGMVGAYATALSFLFFHRAIPRDIFGKLEIGVSGGWVIANCLMVLFGVLFAMALTRQTATKSPSLPHRPAPAPFLPMPKRA